MKSQFERDSRFTQIVNHKMVGREIKQSVTGLEVSATVTKAFEDEHSITLLTSHRPVQWGDQTLITGSVSIRKCDSWIIGNPTIDGIKLTKEDFNA